MNFRIENDTTKDVSIIESLINRFMPFAYENLKYEKPIKIKLLHDDENAKDPLGRTAVYDYGHENEGECSIAVYITARHPKDILRSLAHELIHHDQNCKGQFNDPSLLGDGAVEGYAQNNQHFRKMEEDAYQRGNMLLRDWEDGVKKKGNRFLKEYKDYVDNKKFEENLRKVIKG